LKILLYIVGAILACCLLAVLAGLLFVNPNSYKPAIEAAASEALGMSVRIDGQLRYQPGSPLRLAMDRVTVRNRDTDLALIQQAELAVAPLSLLRGELRYSDITLRGAQISLQRDAAGHYNYEKTVDTRRVAHELNLPRVVFKDLVVKYTDLPGGGGFELSRCNGDLTGLHHPGAAPFLMRLSLQGELACDELRSKATATDVKFTLRARDGVFDFNPLTLRLFGGEGSANVRMDRSGEVPIITGRYSLRQFRIEDFFAAVSPRKSVSGRMDFNASLSMHGRTRAELRASAAGDLSLSGKDLQYSGADLDREFSRYESSQNFSLFDLGAMLFAGPLGLAVTKGYDFSTLALEHGGTTRIQTVDTTWKMSNGIAHAQDVAMATRENRVALQGDLDFVTDQFDGVVVALVDDMGCARLRQNVSGPFGKPAVTKPSVLESLAGPVTGLLSKAKQLLPGRAGCEPFYSGAVAAPH